MSAAPGIPCRGCNPTHRASAVDFSPMHFAEPQSDVPIPQESALDTHHDLTSPMRTTPVHSRMPMWSPISLDPLLQRKNSTSAHTPLPTSQQSGRYCTSNANMAWAAPEGWIPIHGTRLCTSISEWHILQGSYTEVAETEHIRLECRQKAFYRVLWDRAISFTWPTGPLPWIES